MSGTFPKVPGSNMDFRERTRHFWKCSAYLLLAFMPAGTGFAANPEVLPQTATQVAVRHHPKTGKPYVSITAEGADLRQNPLGEAKAAARPDYRMLDYRVKAKDIAYQGPYNDRTKVYVFAGTLAVLGAAGGTAGMIAAPASGAAAGGAGLYAGAGAAVAAGTTTAAWLSTRPDAKKDNYMFESSAKTVENRMENGKQV